MPPLIILVCPAGNERQGVLSSTPVTAISVDICSKGGSEVGEYLVKPLGSAIFRKR